MIIPAYNEEDRLIRCLEIMGLPGAGKSFCNLALLAAAAQQGVPALGRDQALDTAMARLPGGLIKGLCKLLPRSVREPLTGIRTRLPECEQFLADHAALWREVLEVTCRQGYPRGWRRGIIHAFVQQGIQFQLMQTGLRRDETVVWDEGFAHRAFTLFGYLSPYAERAADILRYVAAMPAPAAVVWADTDPSLCAERLEQRPALPILLQGRPRHEMRCQLEEGHRVLQEVASAVEQREIKVYRLSDLDPPGILRHFLGPEAGAARVERDRGFARRATCAGGLR